MSKLSIDCPICLNFHHKKTKFNLCSHAVCNECAYQMLTKCMDKCPICRENIELSIIPDTNIVIDECFTKSKPKVKDLLSYGTNYIDAEEETTAYYDKDDSDYDSDNDGMN